eukprot:CAMPEP_0185263024 /NCGR_PEP_ID=MMETSP1359-20130426/11028_1 /TAXON_ID=552665 /ORGANISM="Bigelowiella longifila, Strain CCMP242" /LENGTH=258 /DNA_ID=CAMNT_0027850125 /DNA_START=119 /DNA_END=895 /DNA_ORIENTATION=+
MADSSADLLEKELADFEILEEAKKEEVCKEPGDGTSSLKNEKEEEKKKDDIGESKTSATGETPQATTPPNENAREKPSALVEKDPEKAVEAKVEGNTLFKTGKFEEALRKYDEAIALCPDDEKESLAAYHCNSAAVHSKMSDWESVIESCTKAIDSKPDYVKAYMRRSVAYEKQDKPVEAYEDIKKADELAPNTARIKARCVKLSVAAQERQEKMKNEMLGKLKDLGNTILGNFGMSLNNFKAQKDPNTGSYNISYQS